MAALTGASLPAACGNCLTSTQLARPGASLLESPWNLLRAGDGRMRLDFGNMSAITDPASARTIILDHLARVARIVSFSPDALRAMAPGLALPGAPGGLAAGAALNVLELGKRLIEGHECDGFRYLLASGLTTLEVWSSSKLHLPVLTTTTGPFGQQISRCTHVPREPDASKFQIPPDYQRVEAAQPPSAPAVPGLQR